MKFKPTPTDPTRKAQINSLFKGRTVDRVEILGLNSWRFHFTDGDPVTIDTFAMGHGFYGPDVIDD